MMVNEESLLDKRGHFHLFNHFIHPVRAADHPIQKQIPILLAGIPLRRFIRLLITTTEALERFLVVFLSAVCYKERQPLCG